MGPWVDIFYRGQNNHLWHRWFEGGWQAEEDLGGVLTSAPAACTWGHRRVDIFYRGQNNHLWHRWFDGGWHAEEDLGGVLTSAPAACTWGPGRVDIFYRGQNNHLWHRWFEGSWQPEEDLGGAMTDTPGACTWGPGRIDILNRGENQHLWHKWFERSGGQVTPAGVPTVTGTRGAVVNPVNPRQLLVAHGNQLLESSDRADSVRDITPQAMTGAVTALAYGTDNSSAAYAGTTSGELFLRTAGNGAPLPVANYPGNGAAVDDIAVDRSNWRRAAVISQNGKLLYTTNAGASWTNIRGNLGDVLRYMRTIELVSTGKDVVILVGGDPPAGHSGIVRTINPDTRRPDPNVIWTEFGTELPHANVFDLRYYPRLILQDGRLGGDLLLAGILGRGAWSMATFLCANGVLFESILRAADLQKGFHTAKTQSRHSRAPLDRALVSESPSYYHFASTPPLGLRVWSRKPSPMPPVTKSVQSGDVGIAYQAMGDGPLDLLIVPSAISHNLGKYRRDRALAPWKSGA